MRNGDWRRVGSRRPRRSPAAARCLPPFLNQGSPTAGPAKLENGRSQQLRTGSSGRDRGHPRASRPADGPAGLPQHVTGEGLENQSAPLPQGRFGNPFPALCGRLAGMTGKRNRPCTGSATSSRIARTRGVRKSSRAISWDSSVIFLQGWKTRLFWSFVWDVGVPRVVGGPCGERSPGGRLVLVPVGWR